MVSVMALNLGCGANYAVNHLSSEALTAAPITTVCNPFGSPVQLSPQYGIHASINYLTASQPRYSQVADYLEYGTAVPADVFLADLNVPTQPFMDGFGTTDGNSVEDNQGNKLLEYFSLHMTTSITLTSAQTPGDYQFAVLSDDGFVMTSNPLSASSQTVINNDGITATRMGCGMSPIHFDATTILPVTMDYFQGPRYEIAAVLMWRSFPTNPGDVKDPLCGASGDHEFFDPTQTPSAQQNNYKALLSRGWTPVGPSNFLLTNGAINTCSS